jgi:HEAT repeat protein
VLEAMFLLATLADEKAAEEALDRFKAAYKNPSAAARATAVTELAKAPHEKTLKQIAPLITGEEVMVRIAAAKGLGSFVDYKKQAIPVLIGSIEGPNAKEPTVQAAIFEALGKLGDETALPTVHRYFEDKDPVVAAAALAAAGEIKKAHSVDVIIELMKKLEKHTDTNAKNPNANTGGVVSLPGGNNDDPNRRLARAVIPACIKALQAITKEKWTTSKEWQIWWGRHKAKFGAEK